MAFLSFHTKPIPWCQFCPAELLHIVGMKAENRCSHPQKVHLRHSIRYQDPLLPESLVWIWSGNNQPTPGNIVSPAKTPRSYIVETPKWGLKKNMSERCPVMTQSH